MSVALCSDEEEAWENSWVGIWQLVKFNLPQWEELRWTQPEQLTQTGQMNTPFHITSDSAINAIKVEYFRLMVFVFQRKHYVWWTYLPWKWLNVCLLMGNSEWISYFVLLAHATFGFPSKLFLSKPTGSHSFTFLILSPTPLRGELVSSSTLLSCLSA